MVDEESGNGVKGDEGGDVALSSRSDLVVKDMQKLLRRKDVGEILHFPL